MAYVRFLGEWYNVAWLGAIAVGLILVLARRPGAGSRVSIFLVAAGVAGLTINGGLHDLGREPVGAKFLVVAAASLSIGALAAWAGPRIRRRLFPPVTGVTFDEPGLEGKPALVLAAGGEHGAGARARYRDEDGVSHVVRVHVDGDEGLALRFGRKIRLGAYDAPRGSYEALAPE